MSASERGIGVRRHQHYVRRLALSAKRLALLHTEAMLLVGGNEAELRERGCVLHQRVCSGDEQRLTALAKRAAIALRSRRKNFPSATPARCRAWREHARDRPRVLLGEQFGQHHESSLIPVLQRQQRREQRDDRLAAAHIALQQPMHPPVAAHVREDFAYRPRLRTGQLKLAVLRTDFGREARACSRR